MENKMTAQLKEVAEIWPRVSGVLSVPKSRKDFNRLLRLMDEILDETGGDEKHPLASLAETIGCLLEAYESSTEIPPDPAEVLRFLMDQHGLRQNDLPEVGSQGVVSEVLSGKRRMNLRQINALSARFHVPIGVFAGKQDF